MLSTFRRRLRRLGFARRSRRLLVFVSSGGTCRDPMAKVIAEKLIQDRVPELKDLKVEGRALLKSTSKSEASHAARMAIRDLFGEDLLADYVPLSISARDIERSDLILVMAADLLHKDELPARKTYIFKEFFGFRGDVEDPWPDGRDEETLTRYRATAEEIKTVMESGIDRLVRTLG